MRVLNPLPPLAGRQSSVFYSDTLDTPLGRALAPLADSHREHAGIVPLASGREAFAARVLLARAAERSIDVQYYIWRGDMTGTLLFEELRRAADRGVRVRILLDDNNTAGLLDGVLAALDSHPGIEVRLFNPFAIRSIRWVNFVTDFRRANRRMHNKSFTVDNQATIIGGRNVGDEYFDAANEGELVFADLDVLAVGSIVPEVSRDFDRYWASGSAYPVARLLPPAPAGALAELDARAARLEHDPAASAYTAAVRELPFVTDLLAGRLAFEWAPVRMLSDDPAKGLGLAPPDALLLTKLAEALGGAKRSIDVVSPYFVPTAAGADAFAALVADGIRVRILVNALEATDVAAVHAGYIKHRKALLRAGIELYEMRLVAGEESGRVGPFGSGASSLHAKTFAVDGERIFIGSFNFDPRSANLNTELGFLIESPPLAERLATLFERTVPEIAYEVRLSPSGRTYWLERRDGETVRHETEPGTTWLQRLTVRLLSWLPIEPIL